MTTLTIKFDKAVIAEVKTPLTPLEVMKKVDAIERAMGIKLEVQIVKEELENEC